jgi:hypothetical protein
MIYERRFGIKLDLLGKRSNFSYTMIVGNK